MKNRVQSRPFSPTAARAARRPAKGVLLLLLAAVCILVAVSFYWLSRKNSADRREQAVVAAQEAAPSAPDNRVVSTSDTRTPDDEAVEPEQRTGTIKDVRITYRVLPARAYFYSAPHPNSSTAKYVLRADLIYANGEIGDFIQTRFYNANGDPVAGWLRKIDVEPVKKRVAVARPSRPATPRRPAPNPAPSPAARPAETKADSPASAENLPPRAPRAIATTGVVRVDTTYFFDAPNLTQRRRAFCIRGDKLKLSESSDKAVFATFVNWEKVTTRGWIRKQDLNIR